MLWIIIISIIIMIIASNRIKSKKSELNNNDLVLFNKYKDMMRGKFIAKRPDNLTEWEQHLWLLASEERNNEGEKKFGKELSISFLR